MEEGLQELQADIDTAHQRADEQRERANPEAAAGDWQDESAGAHQGDDARDAEGGEASSGDDDAPGRDEADRGDDGPRGSVSMDDVPVHEAEQVGPES